jgi:hypothetical protein
MKKYISMLFAACAVIFCSCDAETDVEPGGTAVEKMAGTWTVTFEQSVDEYNAIFEGEADPNLESKSAEELDKLEWEDLFGLEKVTVMTYNTAANDNDKMWLQCTNYYFWTGSSKSVSTQIKCDIDYKARTFQASEQDVYDGCKMKVIGGKVLEKAATTPRGVAADSIVAYVKYSNSIYGFTYMKMSGYRYTGFDADK